MLLECSAILFIKICYIKSKLQKRRKLWKIKQRGGIQMKENKYDDNIFFQKYSQMSRSQQGLAGAGEWETLRKLLPDFKDKRVLDLGCGYGWHCIYAMEHGASSVVGVDISHKMLEVAKEKTHFPQVEYKCCAIEDVEFPEESFDVILSSLAFHYVADYEILVTQLSQLNCPNKPLI